MCNQEQDVSINEFLEVGTQLYVLGQYEEMIGFCREFLQVINDERVHSMLALAQSAINDTKTSTLPPDITTSFPLLFQTISQFLVT